MNKYVPPPSPSFDLQDSHWRWRTHQSTTPSSVLCATWCMPQTLAAILRAKLQSLNHPALTYKALLISKLEVAQTRTKQGDETVDEDLLVKPILLQSLRCAANSSDHLRSLASGDYSPLSLAIAGQHWECVSLLLASGSSAAIPDRNEKHAEILSHKLASDQMQWY